MILQTPPSSNALRFSFFLRLTIELFEFVTTYPITSTPAHRGHPADRTIQSATDSAAHSPLDELLHVLALFDEGWLAILSLQAWDIHSSKGIPTPYNPRPLAPISETDKTLLHSTLNNGGQELEEWVLSNERDIAVDIKEKVGEAFWRTMELLEGVEEGNEGLESIQHGVNGLELDREADDIDADPGIFHGFDDLDDI